MSPIWFRTPSLEDIARHHRGTMVEALGIEIIGFGDDTVHGRMPVDERHRQPYGILHGGASVVLAETLGSLGASLTLDPQAAHCVGLDINANHIRSVREGFVEGTARPLHRGRTTQVWSIDVSTPDGRLVCVSRLTMAVLQGPVRR